MGRCLSWEHFLNILLRKKTSENQSELFAESFKKYIFLCLFSSKHLYSVSYIRISQYRNTHGNPHLLHTIPRRTDRFPPAQTDVWIMLPNPGPSCFLLYCLPSASQPKSLHFPPSSGHSCLKKMTFLQYSAGWLSYHRKAGLKINV